MKAIKALVLGVAMTMSVGTAQAVTYNGSTDTYNVNLKPLLGSDEWSYDLGLIAVKVKGGGAFQDNFELNLTERSYLWFGVAEADKKLSISNVQLWNGDDLVAVGQQFNLGAAVNSVLGLAGQTLNNGLYFVLSKFSSQGDGPELLDEGNYRFVVNGNIATTGYRFYKFGVLATDAPVPPAAVPLPPALLLLGTGLAGLGAMARRRKDAATA